MTQCRTECHEIDMFEFPQVIFASFTFVARHGTNAVAVPTIKSTDEQEKEWYERPAWGATCCVIGMSRVVRAGSWRGSSRRKHGKRSGLSACTCFLPLRKNRVLCTNSSWDAPRMGR